MKKKTNNPQKIRRPGVEKKMRPEPISQRPKVIEKLLNKTALITGGDSGIGKAVALLFAQEGANIALAYLNEHADALETKEKIETVYGRRCILLPGDLKNESLCKAMVKKTFKEFGRIDILVNNAGTQFDEDNLQAITKQNLEKTFETNIFSMIWVTQAVLPFLKKGAVIINTSSVTAYRGSAHLMDYAATKGAIVAFTRSLSSNLVEKGIRVNGVAPGPVWTPLIPATFPKNKVKKHGTSVPMKRAAQPAEIAPAYLYLACEDSSYMTGQFLHPNGGEIING